MGEYRDILLAKGKCIDNRGWRSNSITEDLGRFLAALLKKDFNNSITERAGIDYIAIGNWIGDVAPNNEKFRTRITEFFRRSITDPSKTDPLVDEDGWIWAKQIDRSMIKYLPDDNPPQENGITKKIQIDVKIREDEPAQGEFELREFGLVGTDRFSDGKPNPDKIFLINYVNHDVITKNVNIELSRTIVLTFL